MTNTQTNQNVEGNNGKNQSTVVKAEEMIMQMDNIESLYNIKMIRAESIKKWILTYKKLNLKSEIRGMTYLRTMIQEKTGIKVKSGEATIINIKLLDSILCEIADKVNIEKFRDELKKISAAYIKTGKL
jgi:hypothetical protein